MNRSSFEKKSPSFIDNCRLWCIYGLVPCALFILLANPFLSVQTRYNHLSPIWIWVGPSAFLILFSIMMVIDLFFQEKNGKPVYVQLHIFLGALIIILCISAVVRQPDRAGSNQSVRDEMIEKFAHHRDADMRALALLAFSDGDLWDEKHRALIHQGLLDKDHRVQRAAKLVIEDNFGIRLKNGAEGFTEARSLIQQMDSSALLLRKGLP